MLREPGVGGRVRPGGPHLTNVYRKLGKEG
jgi:hypothetical protein